MANQPKVLSNIEFIAGGLYPGGVLQVKEFCYRLWDYGGTQPPNSNLAVYMLGTPLDGSNEGKDVEEHWNIGSAADFQPISDGAFVASESRAGISEQCKWHFVYEQFKKAGLKPEYLTGPAGIRAIIGSQLQMARMPGPKSSFQDAAPAPGAPQRRGASDVLVPVRAKFPWDTQMGQMPMQASVQQPVQQALGAQPVNGAPAPAWPATIPAVPPAMPQFAPPVAPAPVPMMPAPGAPAGDDTATITAAITAALTAAGGPIEVTKLWVPVNGHLAAIPMAKRVGLLTMAKDQLPALAMANNWQYDGTYLSR